MSDEPSIAGRDQNNDNNGSVKHSTGPVHSTGPEHSHNFDDQQADQGNSIGQSPPVPNRGALSSQGVHQSPPSAIELKRLHRFFGDTKAVHDVSFSVSRGQIYGYIGPNGAGKTTSMKILATLDLPSYGDAFVDGFSVVNDPEFVRQRLGYMPDAFGTYRDVSCIEYLDFFARAHGLIGRERERRLQRVMDFTGTQGMKDKPIRGLSKGMKQRLCLGRSMIHDPAVMILDEPAAGLDPRARIQLRQMIRELADQGKTILISSHILTELAEICDSVGIIEQGKLLATGSVSEIQSQRQECRKLVVRVLSDPEEAANKIKRNLEIKEVLVDGQLLKFEFQGDIQQQAVLVRSLIEQGVELAEVRSHQKSLEDVFLSVTEGLVQ